MGSSGKAKHEKAGISFFAKTATRGREYSSSQSMLRINVYYNTTAFRMKTRERQKDIDL